MVESFISKNLARIPEKRIKKLNFPKFTSRIIAQIELQYCT